MENSLLNLRVQAYLNKFRDKTFPQPKGFGIFLVLVILVNSFEIFNRLTNREVSLVIGILVLLFLLLWFHVSNRLQDAIVSIGIAFIILGILYLEHIFFNISNYQRVHSLVKLGISILVVSIQPILIVKTVHFIWTFFGNKTDFVSNKKSSTPIYLKSHIWPWIASLILVVLFFGLANYDRAGIVGWDTPNYAWRSQLIGLKNGISLHLTYYENGTQVVFSGLAHLFHIIFGFNVWDSIFLLSSILAGIGCVATGWLVFSATRSNHIAIFTIVLCAASFPIARFVADLRDNLAAWVFGTLAIALIALSKDKGNKSIYEILAVICLILTGFSHVAISVVFFLVAGVTSVIWFLDNFTWRDVFHKPITFIKYLRIPLFAVIALILVFIPFLPSYLLSLQKFGLETEALGTSIYTLTGLLENMELFSFGGLTLIGVLGVLSRVRNKQQTYGETLVFVWFLVALSLYLFLPGRLQYRFFFMLPIPALTTIGINQLMNIMTNFDNRKGKGLIVFVFFFLVGILLPYNLAKNYQVVNDRAIWVEKDILNKVQTINSYIKQNNLNPPFVFIMYRDFDAMAYSVLWRNIVLSTIDPVYLLSSYVYFGDLQHYVNAEEEYFNQGELNIPSEYWWSRLEADEVFEHQPTAFIIQSFNSGRYEQYYFDANVDLISPGVLVVKPDSR